ncbi:hypothetical protein TYRP_001572 [Tyrophagus putrescentiae]|nr:hypothetical protein TYRP_001572 [Tyrophagus putrescentiae]
MKLNRVQGADRPILVLTKRVLAARSKIGQRRFQGGGFWPRQKAYDRLRSARQILSAIFFSSKVDQPQLKRSAQSIAVVPQSRSSRKPQTGLAEISAQSIAVVPQTGLAEISAQSIAVVPQTGQTKRGPSQVTDGCAPIKRAKVSSDEVEPPSHTGYGLKKHARSGEESTLI